MDQRLSSPSPRQEWPAGRPLSGGNRRRGGRSGAWFIALSLVLFTALAAGGIARNAHPALAATTLTVTTTLDTPGAQSCTGGPCSLRGAIAVANATPGPVQINVPPGTYTLTNDELQLGDSAGSNITINGTGTPANTIIQQTTANARVFDIDFNVNGDVVVAIANVTITGGVGTSFGGGGILDGDSGDVLTITNDVISGNATASAILGGGIAFSGGGDLIVQNSVISNNTATGSDGGGINFNNGVNSGSLTITGTTFSGNTAGGGDGGGVYANVFTGSTVTISQSTFTGNAAQSGGDPGLGQGGAVFVDNGAASVSFSRIVGNTAQNGGSGVARNAATVSADDNWWGSNAGPGSGALSGVSATRWLELRASPSPSTVTTSPQTSTTVTADLLARNSGGPATPADLTGLPAFPSSGTVFGNAVLGTLSGATQFISGAATVTYTAGATGGNGSVAATADSQTVTAQITVDQPPAITSASSTTFTVGTAGSFPVTATGFPTPALSETGALPAGVTFTDNGAGTATLGGTPAAGSAGVYTLTLKAANGVPTDATQSFTLTVIQPLAITSATSTTFTAGTAGTFTVTTSGSPTPALSESGTLPGGVTFHDNGDGTATLAGTPAAGSGGTYPLTFTASNGSGSNATQSFTLTVNEAASITSASSTTFTTGTAGTFTVTTTGFPKPALAESGSLPSGVTFTDNGNGTATLAGTPASDSGGTHVLALTAHNGIGSDATQNLTVIVNQAASITSATSTTFVVGTAGSFSVTAAGFPTPSISESGALPNGILFQDSGNGTATLSGTAAAGTGGTYPLTFTAHNSAGSDATQSFTLTVNEAVAITSANTTTFAVGSAGNFPVTTTGFPFPTITESGALPGGVSLTDNHDGTADLAGTPSAGSGGTYTLTITAHNGVGSDATQTFTLVVSQPPAITSANSTTFTVGTAGSFTVTATGFPKPSLGENGNLPPGVSLTDNHDGTATLAGTPAPSSGGIYNLSFTAHNLDSYADATQSFTLTVNEAASITSPNSTSFTVGIAGNFTVTSAGFPKPSLAESGSLPSGVTFTANNNGTATLAGTPASGSAGSYPLTLTAHNGVGTDGTQAFTLTVASGTTTITLSPATVQYSDRVTLQATVSGLLSGSVSTGGTVQFSIAGVAVGSANVPSGSNSQTVSVQTIVTKAPGSYDISATFTPSNSSFQSSTTTVHNGLTVTQEDARVTYTGNAYAATPDGTVAATTLALSATVRDITAVTGDPATDSFPGDIRNALVTFVDRTHANATLCTAPVGLVSASDTKTGVVACSATVNLGSATSTSFSIGIVVSGYYTRDSSSDNTSVTVTRTTSNTKIDANGALTASSSAGKYAADNGSQISVSLSATDKGHNNGNNVGAFSGNLSVQLHSGGKTIAIVSSAVTQIAENVGGTKAVVNATATVTDVTDAQHPVVLDSAALVQFTLTDNQGNTPDTLSFTVYGSGTNSGLTLAANWNGTQSLEQALTSGRVKVH